MVNSSHHRSSSSGHRKFLGAPPPHKSSSQKSPPIFKIKKQLHHRLLRNHRSSASNTKCARTGERKVNAATVISVYLRMAPMNSPKHNKQHLQPATLEFKTTKRSSKHPKKWVASNKKDLIQQEPLVISCRQQKTRRSSRRRWITSWWVVRSMTCSIATTFKFTCPSRLNSWLGALSLTWPAK